MVEPLFLKSDFHEKIWGGNHLKDFGYDLSSDKIGEYWAISGHRNGISTVVNGEFSGKTIADLWKSHRELFGNQEGEVFPLLTKILDANDWLSVQVHPDDAYARLHEGEYELGKTECWYIISAEPDAEIVYGHTATSREELAQMINAGEWDKLLKKTPVKAGEFYYVPSGTMHAIGAGIVVLETQQSSDTTYRVYDFDRRDDNGNLRELHLKQSIDTLTIPGDKLPSNETKTEEFAGASITTLLKSPFFDVYKWQIHGSHSFEKSSLYTLVSVLEGAGELEANGQTFEIKKGDHFILPAQIEKWTLSGNLILIASNPE
ncbi:MAG: mannose-6-phosphate isomerase, class I [Streptococcaceae bacterium]|jgi:mannose-6-phosphate isomerase|nr:mannose-6-phosphate isomerase, class I [Streptococcaceae bacterium]